MSSSSQPHKKKSAAKPETNTSNHKESCKISGCTDPSHKKRNLYEVGKEKQIALDMRDKISQILAKDPKAIDKSAFIISEWINNKSKKNK